jgi:hypothetical protein
MKKLLTIALIYILVLTVLIVKTDAYAVVPATPTANQTLLEKLGNEIASKTVQLNLVEKKGIIGTVTDSSNVQITLNDINNNTRFVDVDELTKFSSDANASFGISDVKKGMSLGVLGLYNKQSRRILARSIDVQTSFPTIIFGEISAIDKVKYELTVVKENGGKTVVEIQDITKSYTFLTGNLTKSGFSKIQIMQTISVTGFPDRQDLNKILASQIITLPDIQLNYNLNLAPSAGIIPPSTGSGVKIYPIKK